MRINERLARPVTGLILFSSLGSLGVAGCSAEHRNGQAVVHGVADTTVDNTRHFGLEGAYTVKGKTRQVTSHVEFRCVPKGEIAPIVVEEAKTLLGDQVSYETRKVVRYNRNETCGDVLQAQTAQRAEAYLQDSLNDDAHVVAGDGVRLLTGDRIVDMQHSLIEAAAAGKPV